MKISVIVPVYNVEKYLVQCLDSIVGQTYSDLEIIIVNDGSTDRSPQICDQFAAADQRIRVIHQANAGVSVARNTGIEVATGDYLTFVDSDDWLEADMYMKMRNQLLERPSLDMVMCDSVLITNEHQMKSTDFIRSGYYSKADVLAHLYPVLLVTEDFGKIPVISVWNCLIKRQVLSGKNIRFNADLKYSEDYLFMAALMTQIASFYYLKGEHLYNYRQYEESRSKKLQADWWPTLLHLNKKLSRLLADSKEFDFTRQLKLQLIHSALFLSSAIIDHKGLKTRKKLRLLRKLFTDSELENAFTNLNFDNQSPSLKVVLYLMNRKMALGYLMYRKVVSKLKT